MKLSIVTKNVIAGLHCWPEANGNESYLKGSHRHNFVIRTEISVDGDNREIEIFRAENTIRGYLWRRYSISGDVLDFGTASCEQIAIDIMKNLNMPIVFVEVLEDDGGGARVYK